MLNAIPVVGWLLDLFFKICLAVPMWFIWTVCGIGAKYFGFLPPVWHAVPFWNFVGIFMVLGILKCFSPFNVTGESSNVENKD